MLRLRDLVLLVVIYSSFLGGILMPKVGAIFQPFPLYCMMSFLFLSFLSISITQILDALRKSALLIGAFLLIRMIFLPVAVALLFRAIWPAYSLSALLLTGISTGVVAPFISTLLQANTPLVLVVVVLSSLLVPFTLPPLVDLLFYRTMDISLFSMMSLLFMVIFVPVLIAEIFKRISRSLVERLIATQYPISLFLFTITNLGIFSRYSSFFYQQPMSLLMATAVAFILGGLYFVAGLVLSHGRSVEDQVATIICLGVMNNVLVIVFSSEFFTPLEPTVAAMYMVPFFGIILPLRAYREWKKKGIE
ncbi:MAG: bile acid:sodium symporter [Deltaproteobacteria bacterium]|nr:bile acid:sodium symporter [Deltaproteobacteria bacterium]